MTDRLRVAVIGVGYLGRFHALIYSRMPDVDLVGVVDTDGRRARAVADEAGCPVLPAARSLVGAVDAVSVVVPTTAHLAVAEPMLRGGVHMLMEKPIAATREEGERLVALAEGDVKAIAVVRERIVLVEATGEDLVRREVVQLRRHR